MRALIDFMLKPKLDLALLEQKARELDSENCSDQPETYTLVQMIQIIWHNEPEWLHEHVLEGWVMEEAEAEDEGDGQMRPIWPQLDESPDDTNEAQYGDAQESSNQEAKQE